MKKPPPSFTLRAEEGEALITRVHHSGLRVQDAGVVEQGIRMSCWVVLTLQEAKVSVQRLRALLCGQGRTPKKPPALEASSTSRDPLGEAAGGGELAPS